MRQLRFGGHFGSLYETLHGNVSELQIPGKLLIVKVMVRPLSLPIVQVKVAMVILVEYLCSYLQNVHRLHAFMKVTSLIQKKSQTEKRFVETDKEINDHVSFNLNSLHKLHIA